MPVAPSSVDTNSRIIFTRSGKSTTIMLRADFMGRTCPCGVLKSFAPSTTSSMSADWTGIVADWKNGLIWPRSLVGLTTRLRPTTWGSRLSLAWKLFAIGLQTRAIAESD